MRREQGGTECEASSSNLFSGELGMGVNEYPTELRETLLEGKE
jgi:hypothetical protein